MNRDDITFRELFIHGWPAILAMVLWGAAILALDIIGGVP